MVNATRDWLASFVAGTGVPLPFASRTALVLAGHVRAGTAIPHQVASVDRRVARALADPLRDATTFRRQGSPRAVSMLLATVTDAHDAHGRSCGHLVAMRTWPQDTRIPKKGGVAPSPAS